MVKFPTEAGRKWDGIERKNNNYGRVFLSIGWDGMEWNTYYNTVDITTVARNGTINNEK